jgi:hypothetical protein
MVSPSLTVTNGTRTTIFAIHASALKTVLNPVPTRGLNALSRPKLAANAVLTKLARSRFSPDQLFVALSGNVLRRLVKTNIHLSRTTLLMIALKSSQPAIQLQLIAVALRNLTKALISIQTTAVRLTNVNVNLHVHQMLFFKLRSPALSTMAALTNRRKLPTNAAASNGNASVHQNTASTRTSNTHSANHSTATIRPVKMTCASHACVTLTALSLALITRRLTALLKASNHLLTSVLLAINLFRFRNTNNHQLKIQRPLVLLASTVNVKMPSAISGSQTSRLLLSNAVLV